MLNYVKPKDILSENTETCGLSERTQKEIMKWVSSKLEENIGKQEGNCYCRNQRIQYSSYSDSGLSDLSGLGFNNMPEKKEECSSYYYRTNDWYGYYGFNGLPFMYGCRQRPPQPPLTPEEKKKRRKKMWIRIIIIIFFLLLLAYFLIGDYILSEGETTTVGPSKKDKYIELPTQTSINSGH